jgi:UDP-N-acetyl-D-glucosamine dehydrogenase
MEELFSKIRRHEARVGVIGQGYAGLPLALTFVEGGFPVTGFDVDRRKVDALNRGESYIRHIGPERVAAAVSSGRYEATADYSRLRACDALVICVPTPLGPHREPDNSYIHATAREIAKRLRYGQLIVLESTTYPGTTDREVKEILEESGLRCSQEFLLAFSPEREDPGRVDFTTRTIPKVVGGVDPASTEAAAMLYGAVVDRVVPVSSAAVAESCKLLENVFRCVNIALVNELKVIFAQMGIDVWEVIDAAATKPFGFMPFHPGPGLGGHCIPLDPFFLAWKAAEHGAWTRFIELAGEINARMPAYVVARTAEALNEDGKPLRGARVLVLGLSYKADIDDDRESPSYEILGLLAGAGAAVAYCDPFFPRTPTTRKHRLALESVPVDAKAFSQFDAVVVSTPHRAFKDPALYAAVPLVIDTRNLIARSRGAGAARPRVVKA